MRTWKDNIILELADGKAYGSPCPHGTMVEGDGGLRCVACGAHLSPLWRYDPKRRAPWGTT